MRTKALFLTAAALAAGIATSVAQSNVYSLNIVGYVNKVVPANQYTALATPLLTTDQTVAGVFGGIGGSLPEGAQILIWNGTSFDTGTRDDFETGGWAPAGFEATPVGPGTGYFVFNGLEITVTYVGEVVTGTVTTTVDSGYSFIGSQIPVAGQADTVLEYPANAQTEGNQILQWNGSSWDTYTIDLFETPPWTPSAPSIDVAEGFLSYTPTGFDWVQTFNP
jgi:hypothetical protein